MWIAQPFVVSGESMYPTFHDGEYLIVDEISYITGDPNRGDVIIFKYPKDPSKYFIKRIIGLPGETVTVTGSNVTIQNNAHPDGFTFEEPYVDRPGRRTDDVKVTLQEKEYFVMGDNRAASSDSRIWGPLPEKNIIGTPFVRLTPISMISIHPGAYQMKE
jgi:signal peptidase I